MTKNDCKFFKEGIIEHKCNYCKEKFTTPEHLKTHRENLEAFLKVFCKKCKHFVRVEESSTHFDITYSCVSCKLILPTQDHLEHKCLHKKELQEVASEARRECGICEKAFFTLQDIDGHIKETHSSAFAHYCKCCDVRCESARAFAKHLDGHERKEIAQKPEERRKEAPTLKKIKTDRKRGLWSEKALQSALVSIQTGMSVLEASKTFKVPRSTLRDHIQTGSGKKKLGCNAIFSDEQEQELCKRLYKLADIGMPLTGKELRRSVFIFAEEHSIKHKFNKDSRIAGREWMRLFIKRHPDIIELLKPSKA